MTLNNIILISLLISALVSAGNYLVGVVEIAFNSPLEPTRDLVEYTLMWLGIFVVLFITAVALFTFAAGVMSLLT